MSNIYLDPGHGGTDPGATGNGLQEKNVKLSIALKVRDILNRDYDGHSIRMSRTSDVTRSLTQRTKDATSWGADYLLVFTLMLVVELVMRTSFITVVCLSIQ